MLYVAQQPVTFRMILLSVGKMALWRLLEAGRRRDDEKGFTNMVRRNMFYCKYDSLETTSEQPSSPLVERNDDDTAVPP